MLKAWWSDMFWMNCLRRALCISSSMKFSIAIHTYINRFAISWCMCIQIDLTKTDNTLGLICQYIFRNMPNEGEPEWYNVNWMGSLAQKLSNDTSVWETNLIKVVMKIWKNPNWVVRLINLKKITLIPSTTFAFCNF